MTWDVIVSGSGPAGSAAALVLSRAGARVLVVERSRHPRPKPCAGVLSSRCLDLLRALGLEPATVIRDRLERVSFTFRGRRPSVVDDPGAVTVDRAQHDSWLASEAAAAGARFLTGVKTVGVRRIRDGWEVDTSSGPVRASGLVGADGCPSVIGRSLDLGSARSRWGWGVEATVAADVPAGVGLGFVPGGYTWRFPRSGDVSVGACSFTRGPVHLSRVVRQMVASMLPGHRVRPRGHPLPARPGPLGRGSALVVGDAAGLVDPLTGEGVYAALLSGEAAGRSLAQGLDTDPGAAARHYAERMWDHLSDLRWARMVARTFYRASWLFHRCLTPHGRLSRCFSGLLSGRLRYGEVMRFLITGRG